MNPLKAATRLYQLRSSWLGDGGDPVPTPQAIERAEVCLGCEFNQARFYENIARSAVSWALGIDHLRAELKLSTGHEIGLHVCSKCDCVLRCKVFVPLKHIVATSDVTDLPSFCWITTELATSPLK